MSCENNLVNIAVKALDAKMGRHITVLDVRGLTTITDYFVIATGGSALNIQALSDNVEEKLREEGVHAGGIEGYNTASWVLLGYDDMIVHIFNEESREFYKLEHIWKDGAEVDISDLLIEK